MLVAAGLAITVIGLLFLNQIVNLYGADDSIRSYATGYFRIILLGNVFNVIAFGLNNVIRAEGNAKIAMYTMLIGAITNTVLDPILIYGFNMGVEGAALATIIAQFLSFIWTMHYFISGKSKNKNTTTIKQKNLKRVKKSHRFGGFYCFVFHNILFCFSQYYEYN